jgi:methionyl-tRNA formyltransferase
MKPLRTPPIDAAQELCAIRTIAQPDGLVRCRELTQQVCKRLELDAEDAHAVQLAVEEACTNVVVHGYKGMSPGLLELGFTLLDGRHLLAHIHDHAPPFHPDQAPTPDLSADVDERPVGGLGWLLIRQMMPPIDYRIDPTGNTLVLNRTLHHRTHAPRTRVVLFGSFYRGLHVLQALLEGELSSRVWVAGVATDDPSQSFVSPQKRIWQYPHTREEECMVRRKAEAAGIEVYQGRVKSSAFYDLYENTWKPDLCIMATFGQRIDSRLYRYPAMGFYNLHPCIEDGWPSKYAGGNPFDALIKAGSNHAVVAMHQVDDGFDTGALVAYSRPVPIPPDANVPECHRLTAPVAAELVTQEVARLLDARQTGAQHGAA